MKSLAQTAELRGAVGETDAHAALDVRNDAPAGLDEVIAGSDHDALVVILGPVDDLLVLAAKEELAVAAQDAAPTLLSRLTSSSFKLAVRSIGMMVIGTGLGWPAAGRLENPTPRAELDGPVLVIAGTDCTRPFMSLAVLHFRAGAARKRAQGRPQEPGPPNSALPAVFNAQAPLRFSFIILMVIEPREAFASWQLLFLFIVFWSRPP